MISKADTELRCSPEEAWQLSLDREARDADFSQYKLPKLPDDPAKVHVRLQEAERRIIAADYDQGSATKDDDLLIIPGLDLVLLTAEHATKQMRTHSDGIRSPKIADLGTAALGEVVALETKSRAVIAIGRQTGDANNDEKHLLKDKMTEIIALPDNRAHLSIHGMVRGRASAAEDDRGYSVMLGIGDQASPATKALADFLLEAASDYDLRAGVNQEFLKFDSQAERPVLNADRTIATGIFKAPPHTTRGHAQSVARELGKDELYAAIQIELSSVLRPRRVRAKKQFLTERDQEMGAYLGYLFLRTAVGKVALL